MGPRAAVAEVGETWPSSWTTLHLPWSASHGNQPAQGENPPRALLAVATVEVYAHVRVTTAAACRGDGRRRLRSGGRVGAVVGAVAGARERAKAGIILRHDDRAVVAGALAMDVAREGSRARGRGAWVSTRRLGVGTNGDGSAEAVAVAVTAMTSRIGNWRESDRHRHRRLLEQLAGTRRGREGERASGDSGR